MTSRAIGSTNQWRESKGATVTAARVIDHADFAGWVTFADSGAIAAYLVNDAVHTGFVTPDDSVSVGDADILIIGGGFAVPLEN